MAFKKKTVKKKVPVRPAPPPAPTPDVRISSLQSELDKTYGKLNAANAEIASLKKTKGQKG